MDGITTSLLGAPPYAVPHILRENRFNDHLLEICDDVGRCFLVLKSEFWEGKTSAAVHARVFAAAILLFHHYYDRGRIEIFLDITPTQMSLIHRLFRPLFATHAIPIDAPTKAVIQELNSHILARKRPLNTKVFRRADKRENGVDSIVSFMAAATGTPVETILSPRRGGAAFTARKVAIYASCYLTDAGYTEIGKRIGNRDRKTVANAVNVVEREMSKAGGPPPPGLQIVALLQFLAARMPDLDELIRRRPVFSCHEKRENAFYSACRTQ